MTENAPSRRLRLRFFPQDEAALESAHRTSTHSSRSSVIRGALVLLEQVWSSMGDGFVVVFRRDNDEVSALEIIEAAEGDGDTRADKSVEIRTTRADHERIEALLAAKAAETYSQAVRRALRLYTEALQRCRGGWELLAVSPSGDALAVAVPGLPGAVRRTAQGGAGRGTTVSGRGFEPVREASGEGGLARLHALLPQSLASLVSVLAAHEECPVEILLADLVRVQAERRLQSLSGEPPVSAPEPAAEVAAGDESAPTPAEAAASLQTSEEDLAAMNDLAETFGRMSEAVEKITYLLGKTDQGAGKQAQFSDLLFTAVEELSTASDEGAPDRSMPWLARRARELNGMMSTLVALAQQAEDRKTRRKSGAKSGSERRDKGGQPVQTMLVPAGNKEEWALVLATDEFGMPQQKVVDSETVVPVEQEDLGF